MRPLYLGVTTLVHGFFTLIWIVILLDVGSPTFALHLPQWNASEAALAAAVLFTASAALGVVIHTLSRSVFHRQKETWALEVLTSPTVQERFVGLGAGDTFRGGPTYGEALKAEGRARTTKAGGFLHAVDYQLQVRANKVWRALQAYRDQYRLARGFILPSAAFAPVLPLWEPVRVLDGAADFGFPIIRIQLFLLSVLAASVCYIAFRERSHRYAAGQLLAFATVEGERLKGRTP